RVSGSPAPRRRPSLGAATVPSSAVLSTFLVATVLVMVVAAAGVSAHRLLGHRAHHAARRRCVLPRLPRRLVLAPAGAGGAPAGPQVLALGTVVVAVALVDDGTCGRAALPTAAHAGGPGAAVRDL